MANPIEISPELLAKAKEILEAEQKGMPMELPRDVERKPPAVTAAVDAQQAANRDMPVTFGVPAVHTGPRRTLKDFSIAKAIRGKAFGDWRGAELEREWVRSHPVYLKDGTFETRALDITDDSTGGFLVPEEVAEQVIPMLKAASIVRAMGATIIPNAPQSFLLPGQSGATTAYWVGMTALPGPVTESDPSFRQIRLELKRVAALTKIDMDLLLHAVVSVEALVRRDIAEQIALAEDKAFLIGTGGMQPLGLISIPTVPRTDNVGRPDIDDLYDALHEIDARNGTYNAWAMHPTLWNTIRKTKSEVAEYLLQPNLIEGPRTQVLGLPVYLSTQLTSSYIILGNWPDYVIAEGGALEIHVLRERYADELKIGVLGVHRVDGAPRRPETFHILAGCTP